MRRAVWHITWPRAARKCASYTRPARVPLLDSYLLDDAAHFIVDAIRIPFPSQPRFESD